MKKIVWILLASVSASSFMLRASHTVEEKERLVRQSLLHAVSVVRDNIPDGPFKEVSTNTWEDFLGTPTEGWTLEDRKDAFCTYLTSLGNSNMAAMEELDQTLARVAVAKCRTLAFTNAVPALKAIGMNPKGLYRRDAIALSVDISPWDDSLVSFVETVMTNTVEFTLRERGAASAKLAKKILTASSESQLANNSVLRRATGMLFRNRYASTAGAFMLDKLYCTKYEGYMMSSNRLDFARFILNHPDCESYDQKDFTIITNELLSSGQPLRQLNIGDGQ